MNQCIISVWLPHFATDRIEGKTHLSALPPEARPPFALVTNGKDGRLLAAVNQAAEDAGLSPGMQLADALAMLPALLTEPYNQRAQAKELGRLASWCRRYTPYTATNGAAGLMLDITGCAHPFGGEAQLLADLTWRLERFGFKPQVSVHEGESIAPLMREKVYGGAVIFPEPARQSDNIQDAANRLIFRIMGELACDGKQARRFVLRLFDIKGRVAEVIVMTTKRHAGPDHIAGLFRERLKSFEGRFNGLRGCETMTFEAARIEPLKRIQQLLQRISGEWETSLENVNDLHGVLDRLSARLGCLPGARLQRRFPLQAAPRLLSRQLRNPVTHLTHQMPWTSFI